MTSQDMADILYAGLPEHLEHLERLTFRVQGSANSYQVDMMRNDGRGQCDCPDFVFRHQEAGQCKHIKAVREYLADMVISNALKHPQETTDGP